MGICHRKAGYKNENIRLIPFISLIFTEYIKIIMTGHSLLLDSAGQTCNNALNGSNHAEYKFRGDLDCNHYDRKGCCREDDGWFVLRVTYCRELKLQVKLNNLGIRSFVPMLSISEEKDGKIFRKKVAAVNNLIFVYSTRGKIEDYMFSEGDRQMTHFIWDKTTGRPLMVPIKQMEDFIRISTESADDVIYLSKISEKLRGGAKVKVKTGPFAGVAGTVVRLRKSRRVLVELPGIFAVASAYIPIEDLEIIE